LASKAKSSKSTTRTTSKNTKSKKNTRSGKGTKGRGNAPQTSPAELPELRSVKIKTRKTKLTETSEDAAPWWQSIQATWADEIIAVLLIGIGLLSFLTQFNPSGQLGATWANTLSDLFGMGAYVISILIMAGGVLMLLPKIGIFVPLNWWRITAGEVLFLLVLAYVHAGIRASTGGEAGRIEAFARAIEGGGGGLVGWAVQDAVHLLLGDGMTGVVLLAGIVISGAFTIGIRKSQVLNILNWFEIRLLDIAGEELQARKAAKALPAVAPNSSELAAAEAANPITPERVFIGRPSIVTGRTAAPMSPVREQPAAEEDQEEDEVAAYLRESETREEKIARMLEEGTLEMRFKLADQRDKKKVRSRKDKLPSLDLLEVTSYEQPSDEEINYSAKIIEDTVADFGMEVEVIDVKAGPSVTQYAVQPGQRVRVSRVAGLGNDIALALSASTVRIQAPVPGTNYIGIEVPNRNPGIVSLRPVIEAYEFYKIASPLALGLGRQVDGTPFATDLAAMPHLLIGGTTGSGKSVALRTMAICLIANNTPERLKLIMIDPKMVEMVRFNGLPHLLGRVEVQLDRIIGVLRWVTREMDRRYKLMEEAQARNITTYNKGRRRSSRLPYIVVMIDELAELMSEFPEQTEPLLTRLAQMARATGIHLIVATQRPSTDVITGLIKANFPARIAFAVASGTDSRVILDSTGADELIGKGDMLFYASDAAGPIRLQGSFVSDREMESVIEFWRDNWSEYDETEPAPWQRALTRASLFNDLDPMLEDAIKIVQEEQEASASGLQRKLNVGYPRAARIMDMLHSLGIVGEEEAGGRTRTVLIDTDADPISYIIDKKNNGI